MDIFGEDTDSESDEQVQQDIVGEDGQLPGEIEQKLKKQSVILMKMNTVTPDRNRQK